MSIMRLKVAVPGKHGMSALMLALKEAKIKSEATPLHMHKGHTETHHPKDNNETPIVIVHVVQMKKTINPPLHPLRKI